MEKFMFVAAVVLLIFNGLMTFVMAYAEIPTSWSAGVFPLIVAFQMVVMRQMRRES